MNRCTTSVPCSTGATRCYEDLMMVMEKDKVTVEQGDFVCFRTGFDQVLIEFDRKPDESVHDICAVLDGRDALLRRPHDGNGEGQGHGRAGRFRLLPHGLRPG